MQRKKKQKKPGSFRGKKNFFFDILNREIFGEVVLWKG